MSVRYVPKEQTVLVDDVSAGVIVIESGEFVVYHDSGGTAYTIEEMQDIVVKMKETEKACTILADKIV